MKRTFLSSLLLSLLGIAGPAFAGSVYSPLPDPGGPNGSANSVKIWLSNAGAAPSTIKTTLLEADRDGTQRSTPATPSTLAAGQTLVFNGTAGKVPLLEVAADSASAAINARLTTLGTAAPSSHSALPVTSSSPLCASG